MANNNINLCVLIVAFSLFLLLLNPLECKHHNGNGNGNGFTVDLIRHDKPYITSSSPTTIGGVDLEWLAKSFNLSLSRSAFFSNALITTSKQQSSSSIDAPLTAIQGSYVMELYIGNPPVKIVAIADTGSDLTWTQCKPCIHCYKQNDPLFEPNKSSSYRTLSCDSTQCDSALCHERNNNCAYGVMYGDGSQTYGDLALDTFSFNNKPFFPNTTFGCAHDSSGTFDAKASGIIGLGGGQLSIVNQFSNVISKKFSYCLVPIGEESVSSTSKISFGVDSIPKGSKGAVSTPLIKGSVDTYYLLTLEGVSLVGRHNNNTHRINSVQALEEEEEGNIVIDSGTTYTMLPTQMYDDLKTAIISSISQKPSPGDPSGILNLCYKKMDASELPDMVFHFKGGGDVVIPASNTFIQVSKGGLYCLTIMPTREVAILGNLAQMNFLIEYDIDNQKLSFLPTDCTKFH